MKTGRQKEMTKQTKEGRRTKGGGKITVARTYLSNAFGFAVSVQNP